MKNVIIIKYGEIGLKGKNRYIFESMLMRNIRIAGGFKQNTVYSRYGRIYADTNNKITPENYLQLQEKLAKVFGIIGFSRGIKLPFDTELETLKQLALEQVQQSITSKDKCFKVETRRAAKRYSLNSTQMNMELGGAVLQDYSHLKVNLTQPDLTLHVEIRDEGIVMYTNHHSVPGPGGMPVGASGNGLLLLSGGIDSPVAGWMMMKRGMPIDAIHFYSFPYTGEKSKEKVIDLTKVLRLWKLQPLTLYIPYFTNIQVEINKTCPQSLWTILHRRMMMRIAEKISHNNAKGIKYHALITGENLAQVASQTIENIAVINQATKLPIVRPLIAFDKQDIIEWSHKIDTFRISTLPYEDCCTLFAPRSPETRAKEHEILAAEEKLNVDLLIEEALEKMEVILQ